MKREDLTAGAEYATTLGVRVQVVDTEEIGWSIQGKDWVKDPQFGQRFVKGKGYVPYQNNVALKAVEVDTGAKTVIEPRNLVAEWPEYVKQAKQRQKQEKVAVNNAEALETRASKAGVAVLVDPRKQEVRVGFDAFDTLLRKAKV